MIPDNQCPFRQNWNAYLQKCMAYHKGGPFPNHDFDKGCAIHCPPNCQEDYFKVHDKIMALAQ